MTDIELEPNDDEAFEDDEDELEADDDDSVEQLTSPETIADDED
jgi:hypothetical protein